MKLQKLNITLYAIIFSLIIGIVTAGYLNLINWVIHLIWSPFLTASSSFTKFYPFLICIPFGFAIGFINKKLGDYPLTIQEVLTSFRLNGKINYHNWWKSFILGLTALAAGGSIGPEASTTVLASGMINWLGDRIRWANHFNKNIWYQKMDPHELNHSDKFSQMFKKPWQKKLAIFSLTIIGILGAALVFKLFPEEGVFGIHHRIINWQWLNLLTAIPALIVGIIFSYFFIHLENWFAIIINVKIGKVGQAGIFGILLAVASLISTDILFSGEFRIVAFTKQAFELPAGLLIIIAIVKAIMTNLGFVMGWRGGTIFPAIFSSLAIGVACAKFLPGNPRINAVIALTASLTMILGKPLLTIILLGLLVSIELTPVLIITSLLVNFLQKKYFEKKL